jgi:MbtH protein
MHDTQETEEQQRYRVVMNHEEQYSIWPADKPLPNGWREEGMVGTKDECIRHIDSVWVDMRPLSLRRAMDAAANDSGSA